MNAGMSGRADRFERFASGLLGVALLAGVVWALAYGGPAHEFSFAGLLG